MCRGYTASGEVLFLPLMPERVSRLMRNINWKPWPLKYNFEGENENVDELGRWLDDGGQV